MSGPNTLQPYGSVNKDVRIDSATDTTLFDVTAITDATPDYAWFLTTMDILISQMAAGCILQILDEDGGTIACQFADVVGNFHRAWDAPGKKFPKLKKIIARTIGAGPFIIFINANAHQEPSSAA